MDNASFIRKLFGVESGLIEVSRSYKKIRGTLKQMLRNEFRKLGKTNAYQQRKKELRRLFKSIVKGMPLIHG